MGNRLTRAAAIDVTPMSDRARIVLIRMSVQPYDRPVGDHPAAVYFGGWEYLILPWDDGVRTRGALKQIAMRALAELTRLGKIKPLTDARLGERQNYLILVAY